MEGVKEEGRGSDSKAGIGLRLTERDFDLMGFLYEQKFASLHVLYLRFFDRRKSVEGPVPQNFWVTRQRLAALRRAGFVDTQRVYTQAQALYLLTQRGYEVLRGRRELVIYRDPVRSIDFRYFEHDRRVTLCRVALERQGKCLRWHSDWVLKHRRGYPLLSGKFFRLPGLLLPDGVFVSSKNELVALELEHTPKKRERYADRRDRYRDLFEGESALHRVLLIASTDRIGKDLQEFYGTHPRFQVLSYESLVGSCLGKVAME